MNTTDIKSVSSMLFNRACTCDCMHMWLHARFSQLWITLVIQPIHRKVRFALFECEVQWSVTLVIHQMFQLSWTSHTATLKVTGVRRCCTCSLSRSNQMQSVRTINGHQTTEIMWVLLHSLRQCCFMRNLDFRIWRHWGLFTVSLYLVTQQQATSLCHVSDLFNILGLLPGDKHREQQFNNLI